MVVTHSTIERSTFIAVADDCSVTRAVVPPDNGSIARRQYDLLRAQPGQLTADDVLFTVWADRQELPADEREEARRQFFAKGQPCLRCSPLAKRYGWGFLCDSQGRVTLCGLGSGDYDRALADASLAQRKAMRSSRVG